MEGKKPEDFVVDRISDLPDSILGHILSFLPTDNAVATSILSKRWKLSWVNIHSLDFTFRKKHTGVEIMEFVRFVNRVLLLNDSGLLNKFSFTTSYPLPISRHVRSWIKSAITRNVHELYLSVQDIDMPATLFTCRSLRVLDLYCSGVVSIYDSSVVSLPRLVCLKIQRVRFESEEACRKFINGCPLLQYLKLMIVRFGGDVVVSCMMISSASLRGLEILFVNPSKLKLEASSLEYLSLFGRLTDIFVESSMISLVQAEFKIRSNQHDIPNNSVVEAVREFDCAKYLTLSTDVMRALSCDTVGLSTKFKRLVKLVACAYFCALQDFIQNSENLEDLEIYSDSTCTGSSRWTTPVEVPRCLSNSLKRVQLDYKCLEDAREMVRYMLEHGNVLEVVEIVSCVKEDGEKLLLQEIREFPTKSPACKVQFCSSSRTNSR